ncbi:MAG: hypothetical protein ACFB0D_16055 [Phormidesmis sp.]
MSVKKGLFGAVGLSLLAAGLQLPANAQTTVAAETATETSVVSESAPVDAAILPTSEAIEDLTFNEPQIQLSDLTFSETHTQPLVQAETLSENPVLLAEEFSSQAALPAAELVAVESSSVKPMQPITEAAELGYPAIEAPEEIAQVRRRRTRGGAASGANFIGIGADFGYADDVSFAAISKFSFTEQWAVRPSVLIGDDFSVLVPVTYDFSRFGTQVSGFQLRPYAGAGASFSDSDDDDSDLNLLLSAGIDVPVSQRFTFNAQVNWGVLNDSEFGATVGIGYNLGNIFQ